MKITAIIISKTEIIDKLVIDSIKFADEIIIVVDSPVKKTKTIGNTNIYYHPLNNDFASQRNFALGISKNEWVLFIDGDEYVGSELKREICLLNEKSSYSGFLIPRIDVCFHQPLHFGETGQTKLLRLAKKTAGIFERPVHEKWNIKGEMGELHSSLYHHKDNLISGFIGRMTQYSGIDADILNKEDKPFTYWRLLLNPKGKFIQNYIFRLGCMDGIAGLFLAYLMSIQSLTVRIFQWTKRN